MKCLKILFENVSQKFNLGHKNIKKTIMPKLDASKMKQKPDEFINVAESKYDPNVQMYDYLKSDAGKNFFDRLKKIFQER